MSSANGPVNHEDNPTDPKAPGASAEETRPVAFDLSVADIMIAHGRCSFKKSVSNEGLRASQGSKKAGNNAVARKESTT